MNEPEPIPRVPRVSSISTPPLPPAAPNVLDQLLEAQRETNSLLEQIVRHLDNGSLGVYVTNHYEI